MEEIEEQNLNMPDYLSDHEGDRDGTIINMESYLSDLNSVIEESFFDLIVVNINKFLNENLT